MFRLLEESGFQRVRSAVVPNFRFRKASPRTPLSSGRPAWRGTAARTGAREGPGGNTRRVYLRDLR